MGHDNALVFLLLLLLLRGGGGLRWQISVLSFIFVRGLSK